MLIPNKFNGYKRDGTRLLHIGGGVGEAALLNAMMTGAAVGGGSSIIQGKDPLQGALIGGLMGGAGGAMFGSAGAGAGEAASAVPGAASTTAVLPEAISAQTGSNLGSFSPDFAPLPSTAGAGAPGTSMLGSNPAMQFSIDSMPATVQSAAAPQGIMGQAKDFFAGLTPKQQLLAGGAGIAGLGMVSDQLRGGVPKKKPYTGALSQYRFDPSSYRPYNYAGGGIASLGGYSDGGRMLKGPGDGMSDNIPASIGGKQPARLADGEFVVPADVVSHLGNGSTDAGAKQLYSMMNKVRKARTGNPKQGRQISAGKYLPA
jgi:hypothetical protein